jgi:hypothetical protein
MLCDGSSKTARQTFKKGHEHYMLSKNTSKSAAVRISHLKKALPHYQHAYDAFGAALGKKHFMSKALKKRLVMMRGLERNKMAKLFPGKISNFTESPTLSPTHWDSTSPTKAPTFIPHHQLLLVLMAETTSKTPWFFGALACAAVGLAVLTLKTKKKKTEMHIPV